MALIKNNARVAAQIAVELQTLRTIERSNGDDGATSNNLNDDEWRAPVVVGGAVVDVCYSLTEKDLQVSQE